MAPNRRAARPLRPVDWDLVQANLALAYHQARLLWRALPGLHHLGSVEDAEQEAIAALAKATRYYDASRARFSTFACMVIRHELGGAAVKAMLIHVPAYRPDPKKAVPARAPHGKLRDRPGRAAGPEEDVARQDLAEAVQRAVDRLPEGERWVVRRRWGLDGLPPEDCPHLEVRAGIGAGGISGRWCHAREYLRMALAGLVEA